MNTPDDALDNTPPDNEETVRSDWSKGYDFLMLSLKNYC